MSKDKFFESEDRNALIQAVRRCGHEFRDFESAFEGSTAREIEQRFVDSGLATRRSAGASGYLLSRPCESEFFNVGWDNVRLNQRSEQRLVKNIPQSATVGVYGSSVAMGIGLADHETIPAQLERHLRAQSGNQWNVLNFGNINHCALHSARHFMDRQLSERAVDVAVFLDGWTDLFHAGRTGDGITSLFDALLGELSTTTGATLTVRDLFTRWRNARQSQTLQDGSIRDVPHDDINYWTARVRHQLATAQAVRRAVAEASRRPCVVAEYLEPTIYLHGLDQRVVMPNARDYVDRDREMRTLASTLFESPKDVEWSFAGRTCLSRATDATLDYSLFLDGIHLTPRYCQLVAERIGASITANGAVADSAPRTGFGQKGSS